MSHDLIQTKTENHKLFISDIFPILIKEPFRSEYFWLRKDFRISKYRPKVEHQLQNMFFSVGDFAA